MRRTRRWPAGRAARRQPAVDGLAVQMSTAGLRRAARLSLQPLLEPVERLFALLIGDGVAGALGHADLEFVGDVLLLVGGFGGGEGELGALERAVSVVFAVEDQERPAGKQADHARAIVIVEDAGDHLVPQLAADFLVDLRLTEILRRLLMRTLDGV